MARMHSRRKGKSGSKRILREKPPEWNQRTSEWVIDKTIEFARTGMSASEIGSVLRDEYGVPSVHQITGKKINQILKENNVASKFPEDLLNLIRRAISLRKHMEENKHDYHSKYGLTKIESKIFRLSRYYRNKGEIDSDWKYSPERAALLVR